MTPPHLELFRKFIRFGRADRPLGKRILLSKSTCAIPRCLDRNITNQPRSKRRQPVSVNGTLCQNSTFLQAFATLQIVTTMFEWNIKFPKTGGDQIQFIFYFFCPVISPSPPAPRVSPIIQKMNAPHPHVREMGWYWFMWQLQWKSDWSTQIRQEQQIILKYPSTWQIAVGRKQISPKWTKLKLFDHPGNPLWLTFHLEAQWQPC